eukprot:5432287-Pyramimonas_sp.AAC.1
MALTADKSAIENQAVRQFILGWRSCKLRRRVPSTLAGRPQALSAAVAEVEYLQVLCRGIVFGTSTFQT